MGVFERLNCYKHKDTDFDGKPDGKGYEELQRLENVYGKDVEQLLSRIGMIDNRVTRETVAGGSRVNYITANLVRTIKI